MKSFIHRNHHNLEGRKTVIYVIIKQDYDQRKNTHHTKLL